MRHTLLIAVTAVLAAGCGRTPKVDNPVFGPPPPRVSFDDTPGVGGDAYVNNPLDPSSEDVGPGEVVRTVSATDEPPLQLVSATASSMVVARVNGEPIFEGDILEPYAGKLEQARQQVSEEGFEVAKRGLVKRDLPAHIDRKLLVQALKQSLKAEQYNSIQGRLDSVFEEEAAKMREKAGVTTNFELNQKLEAEGQSLGAIRRAFVNQQLAFVYMSQNAQREFEIGRADLLEYYNRHRSEYEIEAKARWQRFVVTFSKHGGRKKSLPILERAVAELERNANFEDVVRAYSDGPRASKGGYWEWTRKGELKDAEVEKALFTMPIDKLSRVIVNDESYQIVKVLERQEEGLVPFEEVQEEIQFAVEGELKKAATDRILVDLKAKSEITTIFDDEKDEDDGYVLPFN